MLHASCKCWTSSCFTSFTQIGTTVHFNETCVQLVHQSRVQQLNIRFSNCILHYTLRANIKLVECATFARRYQQENVNTLGFDCQSKDVQYQTTWCKIWISLAIVTLFEKFRRTLHRRCNIWNKVAAMHKICILKIWKTRKKQIYKLIILILLLNKRSKNQFIFIFLKQWYSNSLALYMPRSYFSILIMHSYWSHLHFTAVNSRCSFIFLRLSTSKGKVPTTRERLMHDFCANWRPISALILCDLLRLIHQNVLLEAPR